MNSNIKLERLNYKKKKKNNEGIKNNEVPRNTHGDKKPKGHENCKGTAVSWMGF